MIWRKMADILVQLQEPEHEIVTLKGNASDKEVGQQVREVIAKMQSGRYGKKALLRFEDVQ